MYLHNVFCIYIEVTEFSLHIPSILYASLWYKKDYFFCKKTQTLFTLYFYLEHAKNVL